jgi:hypothetical protein
MRLPIVNRPLNPRYPGAAILGHRSRHASGAPHPTAQEGSVELNGVLLGTTVEHELGVRFIAANARVIDMDQSIWPNQDYARLSARQLFRSQPPAE